MHSHFPTTKLFLNSYILKWAGTIKKVRKQSSWRIIVLCLCNLCWFWTNVACVCPCKFILVHRMDKDKKLHGCFFPTYSFSTCNITLPKRNEVFSKHTQKILFLKRNLTLQQILTPSFNRFPADYFLNLKLSAEIDTAQLSDSNG